jgi:hypothetical protein
MNKVTNRQVLRLAENGKSPVVFHRNGTVSYRDDEGRWTRHLAVVPPSIIMKLDRDTRARLWYRNFKVERAWAEANA